METSMSNNDVFGERLKVEDIVETPKTKNFQAWKTFSVLDEGDTFALKVGGVRRVKSGSKRHTDVDGNNEREARKHERVFDVLAEAKGKALLFVDVALGQIFRVPNSDMIFKKDDHFNYHDIHGTKFQLRGASNFMILTVPEKGKGLAKAMKDLRSKPTQSMAYSETWKDIPFTAAELQTLADGGSGYVDVAEPAPVVAVFNVVIEGQRVDDEDKGLVPGETAMVFDHETGNKKKRPRVDSAATYLDSEGVQHLKHSFTSFVSTIQALLKDGSTYSGVKEASLTNRLARFYCVGHDTIWRALRGIGNPVFLISVPNPFPVKEMEYRLGSKHLGSKQKEEDVNKPMAKTGYAGAVAPFFVENGARAKDPQLALPADPLHTNTRLLSSLHRLQEVQALDLILDGVLLKERADLQVAEARNTALTEEVRNLTEQFVVGENRFLTSRTSLPNNTVVIKGLDLFMNVGGMEVRIDADVAMELATELNAKAGRIRKAREILDGNDRSL